MAINPSIVTMLVGVISLIVSIVVVVRNGSRDTAHSAREIGELKSDIRHILDDIAKMSEKLDRIEEDRAEHDRRVSDKIMDLDNRVTKLETENKA